MTSTLAALRRDWPSYTFMATICLVFLTQAAAGAYILIRDAQVVCQ